MRSRTPRYSAVLAADDGSVRRAPPAQGDAGPGGRRARPAGSRGRPGTAARRVVGRAQQPGRQVQRERGLADAARARSAGWRAAASRGPWPRSRRAPVRGPASGRRPRRRLAGGGLARSCGASGPPRRPSRRPRRRHPRPPSRSSPCGWSAASGRRRPSRRHRRTPATRRRGSPRSRPSCGWCAASVRPPPRSVAVADLAAAFVRRRGRLAGRAATRGRRSTVDGSADDVGSTSDGCRRGRRRRGFGGDLRAQLRLELRRDLAPLAGLRAAAPACGRPVPPVAAASPRSYERSTRGAAADRSRPDSG